jgi:hypothetical protein
VQQEQYRCGISKSLKSSGENGSPVIEKSGAFFILVISGIKNIYAAFKCTITVLFI